MRGGFRACGEVATAASADVAVADALRAGNLEAEVYGSADVTYDPQDPDRRVGRGAGRNRDGRLDGAGAGTWRQQSGSPAIVRAERSAALS